MKNKLTEPKFRFPRRFALYLFGAAAIFLSVGPLGAAQFHTVIGGSTGTFYADLDGDGDIDGTYFGFAAIQNAGGLQGNFLCEMAAKFDFLGLDLMLVQGRISRASFAPTSVRFSGTADVTFEPGDVFADVPFTAIVTAGGPRVGTLQLTLIGVFDGTPGDTIPGDNNYSLPVETVLTGSIFIH